MPMKTSRGESRAGVINVIGWKYTMIYLGYLVHNGVSGSNYVEGLRVSLMNRYEGSSISTNKGFSVSVPNLLERSSENVGMSRTCKVHNVDMS